MPVINVSYKSKVKSNQRLIILAGFLCANFLVNAAVANTIEKRLPEFEDVYRIEVIIFTNRNNLDNSEANNDSDVTEYWNDNPELDYPDNLVFLHPPPKEFPLSDTTNEPALTEEVISLDIEAPITAEAIDNLLLASSPATTAVEDTRTHKEKTLASLPLLEQLEAETFLLNDMANAIDRRSNHNVLFHHAWHQELGAKETAPSIPVAGGDIYDDHRELEGSIKINKDRYLHITTDLWLTQYSLRNDEQWQELTREPSENSLLTAKIIDINSVPDFPVDSVRVAEDKLIREAEIAEMIEQEALYEFSLEHGEQANNNRAPPNQHDEAGKYDNELEDDFFEDDSESDLNFDQFEASKTFVLKEHRKMKRAEIHFLDHPMLGLIIQITKYEIPEVLETVADELVADESETAEPEAIKTN